MAFYEIEIVQSPATGNTLTPAERAALGLAVDDPRDSAVGIQVVRVTPTGREGVGNTTYVPFILATASVNRPYFVNLVEAAAGVIIDADRAQVVTLGVASVADLVGRKFQVYR
jgi:hypothetical protein